METHSYDALERNATVSSSVTMGSNGHTVHVHKWPQSDFLMTQFNSLSELVTSEAYVSFRLLVIETKRFPYIIFIL